jgi:hypothetical protein
VVLEQVFPAGGSSSASTYKYDYVVLHNRGATSVNVATWSLQYSAASSSTWTPSPLTGAPVLPPGGRILIQLGSAGSNAASLNLPTPDLAIGTMNLSASGGKVALVKNTTALSGCPLPNAGALADFVGYGTANCSEGTVVTAPGLTQAAVRKGNGCTDTDSNSADFALVTPALAVNAATATVTECSCGSALTEDEAGKPGEIDYVVTQAPKSGSIALGSSFTAYGQIYLTNGASQITGSGSQVAGITAQLGYAVAAADGSPLTNPEYEAGWTWVATTYNSFCAPGTGHSAPYTDCGNNDEYLASFTPVASGKYVYTFRFSIDGGSTWTYADNDGSGSNNGLTFDLVQLAKLTVN